MVKLRNRHLLVLDTVTWLLIPVVALSLRLERLDWWSETGAALILFSVIAVLVKFPVFYSLGLYNRYWRSANAKDLVAAMLAVGVSTFLLTVGFLIAYPSLHQHNLAMYRTVPLIDGLLTCLTVGGARLSFWALYHWRLPFGRVIGGRRTLIVGAGEAGTLVVHEMRVNHRLNMEPIAFVDDDAIKIGKTIRGLPVLGSTRDIPTIIAKHKIQRIIVAMPSAPLIRRREIVDQCRQLHIATETVPGMYEILAGSKTISRTPAFDINDLLHREPVMIDQAEVRACLSGATVLVTGAGGSIGSELCRQIARFGPRELILLGHGENSIFEVSLDLRLSFPTLTTHSVIADVRDRGRIFQIIEQYRPDIIFHAAAHKHVPLMEANVEEAITNNVLGTENVLRASEHVGVSRLVLVSTDKAINPTSIMGTTKRLAELLTLATAHRSRQAYMAVRFGNVLGSRGSVVPVFLQQIAAGGPITVTHPEMTRYFMSIPEAVQLLLQAAVLGKGGEIFMLDMGKPHRIQDLATDLIKLAGLEPERDIQIVYSGVRPGEKMHEELFMESEQSQRTKHQQIFVATNDNYAEAETVARLVEMASQKYSPAPTQQPQPFLLQQSSPARVHRVSEPEVRVPEMATLEVGLTVG